MNDYKIDEVNIINLDVDLQNPRHDIAASQREALLDMVEEQKEKLLNLAEDILKNGINPSDLPIVIPHERESSKYTVLEGNRRVTALKFLNEDSIADGIKNKSLQGRFKRLSKKFQDSPITKLSCVIFQTRKEASKWIRLRHTGENKGIGIVTWGAKEKARFEHNLGRPSLALQAINFVQENSELDDATKANLEKIHITNLDRLLGDKDVQKFIGFYVSEGKLYSIFPKDQILKGLTRVVTDIANKEINVTDIYYKDQRKGYIQKFDTKDIPDHSKETSPWSFDAVFKEDIKASSSTSTKPNVRIKPLSIDRKTLIPSDCKLKINDKRINSIYHELRNLKVDDFHNASAVLLRVFFELSLDHYIEKNSITKVTINDKLNVKLEYISKHFEANSVLDKYQLKPVRTAISSPDSIFSVNTFNAYVHNKNLHPSPKELKLAWDNFQIFIEKIWA